MSGGRSPPRARLRPAPVEWLCLAAGLFLVLRYAWLLDDAFVFFRYVDNLLFLGRGLVFNEGEAVEGFSSPAWTLLLIPLRASEANYWLIVRAVGAACFVLFWLLLVLLRRATEPVPATGVVNLPLAYLALLYPVASYFTSGMETPLVQISAAAFALFVFAPRARLAQVLVGLAPLVRAELALPLFVALAWSWIRERRFPWLPCAVAAATSGGWLLFRVWYYADLLPNTFYLKDQVRLDWGLAYLHDALVPYGAYPLALLLGGLALLLARRGVAVELEKRLLLLALAALVAAYVVKIGGDGRHYRYLAFPFCLAVSAGAGLAERGLVLLAGRARPWHAQMATGLALFFAVGSAALYPRQLSAHPLSAGVVEEKVGLIRDAQYHRAQPDIGYSPWSSGAESEAYSGPEAERLCEANGEPPPERELRLLEEYARYRREVRPARAPNTRTGGWCYSMWKGFNERWLHKDGLTDALLARTTAKPWRPGHYKEEELGRLTLDMARVQNTYGARRGAYREALAAGDGAPWIARNLESIELVEQKIHNRRDLFENLRLAATRVPRIEPGPETQRPAGAHAPAGPVRSAAPGLLDADAVADGEGRAVEQLAGEVDLQEGERSGRSRAGAPPPWPACRTSC